MLLCVLQEHFVDVIRNQEFMLLPAEELERVLSSEDLNVPSEELVFHALILWVKHDRDVRRHHLPSLLAQVRLPLLSAQVCHVKDVKYQLSSI